MSINNTNNNNNCDIDLLLSEIHNNNITRQDSKVSSQQIEQSQKPNINSESRVKIYSHLVNQFNATDNKIKTTNINIRN